MLILTNRDLRRIDIPAAADALRAFLIESSLGRTESPPRQGVDLGEDALVFTSGAGRDHFGFRAYTSRDGLHRAQEDQVVACWDRQSHDLLAIATGDLLGAWRTGLLGGLARQALAPEGGGICGVLGTGLQSGMQARVTAVLSAPAKFVVYSRDAERRDRFARELQADTSIETVAAEGPRPLVESARTLIVATRSPQPVFDIEWLQDCRHVTTVGPKLRSAHELPSAIADWAEVVVSDSPQQIALQGADHFLAAKLMDREIVNLGKVIRESDGSLRNTRTLYLSAGLSGTEVALLAVLAQLKDSR